MSEEPAAKKNKTEEATPGKLTTFYIRGQSLRHRGDVVNGLLCQWREQLGLADWYEATGEEGHTHHLLPQCPLEMVHVESSRRPYFLLEFRYPNEEELARQERNREAGEHKEEEEKKDAEEQKPKEKTAEKVLPTVSEEALHDIAARLLKLATTEKSPLTYKEKPVSISVALAGVTVAAERNKLELRDAEKKKQRQQEQERQQKEAQAASAAAQASAPTTTTSFVPRTVRRRT